MQWYVGSPSLTVSRHIGVSTFLNGGMIIKTDLNFTAVSFVIQQNLNIKQGQLYTVCPIILVHILWKPKMYYLAKLENENVDALGQNYKLKYIHSFLL